MDENETREITMYLPYAMSIYGKLASGFLGIQDHIPSERNVRAEEESKQKETEEEIEGNADDIAFIKHSNFSARKGSIKSHNKLGNCKIKLCPNQNNYHAL